MTRDLRKHAKQTRTQLVIGFIFLLLIVGDGLIYLVYGPAGAISGLLCIIAGLAPLGLIWLAMNIIEWIAKKANG